MRRVLMVSPHFPPDSSAASHRVRLLAPHLEDAGWSPTVVTLESSAYEGRLNPGLEALVPPSLRVVRAAAWPAAATRRIGIGDLGLRAFTGLRRTCRALLAREQFDALFITVYPVYPALLGAGLKAAYRVPFVLDYQDPWVGAWGQSVGGGPGGSADWKSRASRSLGTWLEPKAVNAADALVAVSQGTIDGIVERIPAAARIPHAVIPLGFEPADVVSLGGGPRAPCRSIRPMATCTCATSARCCRPVSRRCACCFAASSAPVATIRRPPGCACTSSAPATSRTRASIECCRSRAPAASKMR